VTRKQKKRSTQALLTVQEIQNIRAALETVEEAALFEWLYTNGARASEPGLAKLSDLDLRTNRVRLVHLKHGLAPIGVPIAPPCRAALEKWLPVRPPYDDARVDYVFPRAAGIINCYECKGTGHVEREFRDKQTRQRVKRTVKCPLCIGAGRCPGFTRHDVRHRMVRLFTRAGIHEDLHFPHVLRHSAVTHMLDAGILTPPQIQQRVGHKALETTFGYMHATQEAQDDIARTFPMPEDPG